jgi:hypothetical protein
MNILLIIHHKRERRESIVRALRPLLILGPSILNHRDTPLHLHHLLNIFAPRHMTIMSDKTRMFNAQADRAMVRGVG